MSRLSPIPRTCVVRVTVPGPSRHTGNTLPLGFIGSFLPSLRGRSLIVSMTEHISIEQRPNEDGISKLVGSWFVWPISDLVQFSRMPRTYLTPLCPIKMSRVAQKSIFSSRSYATHRDSLCSIITSAHSKQRCSSSIPHTLESLPNCS